MLQPGTFKPMDTTTSTRLTLMQTVGIGVGIVGIVIGVVAGLATGLDRFFQVYLISFSLWLDLSLGCLGFLLLLHLVDGRWGFMLQRVFAAGARVMPLMALLFIPLLVRLPALYPWIGEGTESHGAGYDTFHSLWFFLLRVVLYFGLWTFMAYRLSNQTYATDSDNGPDEAKYAPVQRFAAGMLLVFALLVTFASMDFTMSNTEAWFSTIWGALALGRQGFLAMTFAVVIAALVANDESIKKLYTGQVQRDIATLVLVTMLVWIYMTVMQYFIFWSGNQPSKIKWFVPRTTGVWANWVTFLTFAHAIPLLLFLTPGLKKYRLVIVGLASWLFLMRLAEYFWLVLPTYAPDRLFNVLDLALPIGFGGLWVAAFAYMYRAQPLVPKNHPHLAEALAHDTPEQFEGVETA